MQSESLKRSLVAEFISSKGEASTLLQVRKWANGLWQKVHGLYIYEMGEVFFFLNSHPK